MRFDPARLQFMQAGEIALAPHAAAVGLDIRVVGNDSGEKARVAGHVLTMQQPARSSKSSFRGYWDPWQQKHVVWQAWPEPAACPGNRPPSHPPTCARSLPR